MKTLVEAASDGRLLGIDTDGAPQISQAAADDDRAQIIVALSTAPAASVAAVRNMLATATAMRAEAAAEATRRREEAHRLGYGEGRARADRIVAALPETLCVAIRAYRRGDIAWRATTDDAPNRRSLVATRQDARTQALARAVRETGLASVFEAIAASDEQFALSAADAAETARPAGWR